MTPLSPRSADIGFTGSVKRGNCADLLPRRQTSLRKELAQRRAQRHMRASTTRGNNPSGDSAKSRLEDVRHPPVRQSGQIRQPPRTALWLGLCGRGSHARSTKDTPSGSSFVPFENQSRKSLSCSLSSATSCCGARRILWCTLCWARHHESREEAAPRQGWRFPPPSRNPNWQAS